MTISVDEREDDNRRRNHLPIGTSSTAAHIIDINKSFMTISKPSVDINEDMSKGKLPVTYSKLRIPTLAIQPPRTNAIVPAILLLLENGHFTVPNLLIIPNTVSNLTYACK